MSVSPNPDSPVLAAAVDYDVIVVGAGLAGLTAARTLRSKQPDIKILVLEGKDRVGGRTHTVELPVAGGVDLFDLGGQWISSAQDEANALLKELGIELYEQYATGKKRLQLGSTKIRTVDDPMEFFGPEAFSLWEKASLFVRFQQMEKMAQKLDPTNIFAWRDADWADKQSVAKWAEDLKPSTRSTTDAFVYTIKSLYGVEAKRMSLLYHLLFCRSAGSYMNLIETADPGAQGYKIKGGSQQMSIRMATDLGENRVKLNCELKSVQTSRTGGPTAVTFTEGGEEKTLTCTRLILAIPPNECGKITFSPPLPYLKKRLFDNATPGHFIKFIATYKTAFWRDEGLSGESCSSGRTNNKSETTPLVETYDGTSCNGNAALVGFIRSELHDSTERERKFFVIEELVKFFGEKARTELVHFAVKNWAEEKLNGGCPVDYMTPGNMDAYTTIRDAHFGVHFAGTETAINWMGYMNGAIESGKRAANEVLLVMGQNALVDYQYLRGSQFAPDYRRPDLPSEHYTEGVWLRSRI